MSPQPSVAVYIVRSNTRDLQCHHCHSRIDPLYLGAVDFYDDNNLRPGSTNHGVYASVEDANNHAKALLRQVYQFRDGDDFIERWSADRILDMITYRDGCLRMVEVLMAKSYCSFVRDFPYTVFVDKFEITAASEPSVAEQLVHSNATNLMDMQWEFERPQAHASNSPAPIAPMAPNLANSNPNETLGSNYNSLPAHNPASAAPQPPADQPFKPLAVYKVIKVTSNQSPNRNGIPCSYGGFFDQYCSSDSDGENPIFDPHASRTETYYLSKVNALNGFKLAVDDTPMRFGMGDHQDYIQYNGPGGLPTWSNNYDDDYIRTEFSMVTEIMMVKIRKRRKYNKKGAKTEKGDVVFRDWDGTEESYSVLSSRPGF